MNNSIPQAKINRDEASELASAVSFVKSNLPQEKRETYFENTLKQLPVFSQSEGQRLLDSVVPLYNSRSFCEAAGLDYSDPNGDNGQLIRIAAARVLEQKYLN